ncbi:MAG: peptidase MA family metallohydrolase [Candidatus Omnitrophica bacterium]|nr:peptidase MA family metallohydrolase [Candidatus Omnitrophota bacterium]MDD5552926.1 peptidase MA family metallohydrolase [Candidatus Omnitrophota bacterium]
MKRYLLAAAFVFLCVPRVFAADGDWSVEKSTHFLVYYKNAPAGFIGELIEKSENYYNEIADKLGFRRFDFWLWDDRAKIYIHDDARAFQEATGQQSWSAGCAMVNEKIIHSFPYAHGFFDGTLPHEMGHIIFREFVGFNNRAVPWWLDEAVATYVEERAHSSACSIVKDALASGKFIGLESIPGINPYLAENDAAVLIFYAEVECLIGYLVNEFGKDNFMLFCQNLRDKRDLERALSYVYPFRNIAELETAWRKNLQ